MLIDTAQITLDLYYRDYPTDEEFFTIQQAMYLCGVAYAKLIEDEYLEARRIARQEEGYTDVLIGSDWLRESILEVKPSTLYPGTLEAILDSHVMSFPYDSYGYGVQTVKPIGKPCGDFVRVSERESWMHTKLPFTKHAFFWLIGKRLLIRNYQCKLEQVQVLAVPEITDPVFGKDGGPIPKGKEDLIIRKTLELLIRSREGNVINMTNDSNPNAIQQTEINQQNLKPNP